MMQMRQKGFSFLELTAVLAIVGVLLSIAIPYYTLYLKRAKVSEMLGLLRDAANTAALYYSETGKLPVDMDADALGFKWEGKYTQNIEFSRGVFTGTLKSPEFQGMRLSIRFAATNAVSPKNLLLLCGYAQAPEHFTVYGENQTNFPPEYLPYICRKY